MAEALWHALPASQSVYLRPLGGLSLSSALPKDLFTVTLGGEGGEAASLAASSDDQNLRSLILDATFSEVYKALPLQFVASDALAPDFLARSSYAPPFIYHQCSYSG